ncbi:hypothetical protein B0H17DRAFT_1145993 [Mycena rosella]|uniref:Uncharacterized protein n=1 Tax=Mycena rosella TaxID=1033263 RepID=A0AAD7CPT0_MYCRO|nr:hypothetical protein B0H17DRAFT_1145993 [Mycena rosella]
MAEHYDYDDYHDDHFPYPDTSTPSDTYYPDSEDLHYNHCPHATDHYTYTDDPWPGDNCADDSYDPYAYAGTYTRTPVADVAEYDTQHIPYGVDHDTYTPVHAPYENDGTMTLEYGQPGYWEEHHRRWDEIIYGTPLTPHFPDAYYSHEGVTEPAEEELQYAEACAYSTATHAQAEARRARARHRACTAAYARGELQEHEVDTWLEVIEEMHEIEAEERRIVAEGYFWNEATAHSAPYALVASSLRSPDSYPSHFPRPRPPPKPPCHRPLPFVMRGPLARQGHHYQPRFTIKPRLRRLSPTAYHANDLHIKNPHALATTSDSRTPPSPFTRDADATLSASVSTPPAIADDSRCSPDTAVVDPASIPLPSSRCSFRPRSTHPASRSHLSLLRTRARCRR